MSNPVILSMKKENTLIHVRENGEAEFQDFLPGGVVREYDADYWTSKFKLSQHPEFEVFARQELIRFGYDEIKKEQKKCEQKN